MLEIKKNILTKSNVEEVIRKKFGNIIYAIDFSGTGDSENTYWADVILDYLNNDISSFALSTVYEDKNTHILIEPNTITVKTYKKDVLVGIEVCTRIVGRFTMTNSDLQNSYYVVSFGKKGLFKKVKPFNKGNIGTRYTRDFITYNKQDEIWTPCYVYDSITTFKNVGKEQKERIFDNGTVVTHIGRSKEILWAIKDTFNCKSFQNIEAADAVIQKIVYPDTVAESSIFC